MKSAFDAIDPPSMDGLRACVHCGICLPQCPTYRVLGQEMDSPRGRLYLMRAAAEGRTALTPQLAHHLDLCLGCRACETACPSGVPFGQLLEATRGQLERAGVTSGSPSPATAGSAGSSDSSARSRLNGASRSSPRTAAWSPVLW